MPDLSFQEMRNLLRHGAEQIVELFEKEIGTETIYHIVIVTHAIPTGCFRQTDISVPPRSN